MLSILFWILVGMFIGWNVERPEWSRQLQDRVVAWVKQLFNKNK